MNDPYVFEHIKQSCKQIRAATTYSERQDKGSAVVLVMAECLADKLTWLQAGPETNTFVCRDLARITRQLAALTVAMQAPPSGMVTPLTYDESTRTFVPATCALCPSEPDSIRLNGLCSSCDIAEHGEGMDDVLEHLHSEVGL